MIDMEICIDQIANMRVEQMNLVMEATRRTVLSKYAPGEDDLYMRTLELGQVQESDFYSHVMLDDLDSIVRDIREAHLKDKTTAEARQIATGRMAKNAEELGADAVVGMRYASASVMQGAAEVIAYGTAVRFV